MGDWKLEPERPLRETRRGCKGWWAYSSETLSITEVPCNRQQYYSERFRRRVWSFYPLVHERQQDAKLSSRTAWKHHSGCFDQVPAGLKCILSWDCSKLKVCCSDRGASQVQRWGSDQRYQEQNITRFIKWFWLATRNFQIDWRAKDQLAWCRRFQMGFYWFRIQS